MEGSGLQGLRIFGFPASLQVISAAEDARKIFKSSKDLCGRQVVDGQGCVDAAEAIKTFVPVMQAASMCLSCWKRRHATVNLCSVGAHIPCNSKSDLLGQFCSCSTCHGTVHRARAGVRGPWKPTSATPRACGISPARSRAEKLLVQEHLRKFKRFGVLKSMKCIIIIIMGKQISYCYYFQLNSMRFQCTLSLLSFIGCGILRALCGEATSLWWLRRWLRQRRRKQYVSRGPAATYRDET